MLETIIQGTAQFSLSFAIPLTLICTPGFLYDRFEIAKNRLVTGVEHNAAILINYTLGQELANFVFGYRGQIAKFFTEFNIRAHWVYNATYEDLKNYIEDPFYQSIAVVGHGDTNAWVAKDTLVISEMIKSLRKSHLKSGYWLQLTCGSENNECLGESIMADKTKILGYKTPVNTFMKTMACVPLCD